MSSEQIREALERGARAVSLRPAIARKTGRTAVRLQPGLACEITDGPWTLTASLGAAAGVAPVGPGPGTLGRGALGSCLARAGDRPLGDDGRRRRRRGCAPGRRDRDRGAD